MCAKQRRGRGRATDLPRLLGGRLCLDFANTIERRISETPEEFLRDYDDLIRWSWHAGAVEEEDTARLADLATTDADSAAAAFAAARELRGSVISVFAAVAAGGAPRAADLASVKNEHTRALVAASLVRAGDSFVWSWRGVEDLRLPLWLVATSAVELLVSLDLRRVKQCPGARDCGWLFLDASRNATRRWCSMEGCGSRVKMRRRYARQKHAE